MVADTPQAEQVLRRSLRPKQHGLQRNHSGTRHLHIKSIGAGTKHFQRPCFARAPTTSFAENHSAGHVAEINSGVNRILVNMPSRSWHHLRLSTRTPCTSDDINGNTSATTGQLHSARVGTPRRHSINNTNYLSDGHRGSHRVKGHPLFVMTAIVDRTHSAQTKEDRATHPTAHVREAQTASRATLSQPIRTQHQGIQGGRLALVPPRSVAHLRGVALLKPQSGRMSSIPLVSLQPSRLNQFAQPQVLVEDAQPSTLEGDGPVRGGAPSSDGVALAEARRRKERTYPQLYGERGKARLFAMAGKWAAGAQEFLRSSSLALHVVLHPLVCFCSDLFSASPCRFWAHSFRLRKEVCFVQVLFRQCFVRVLCLSFLSFASGKHLWGSLATLSQKVVSSFVSISISFCAALFFYATKPSSSNLSRRRRHSTTSNRTSCAPARSLHAPLAQPFSHTFPCIP